MKLDYENTTLIKDWLKDNNLSPSADPKLAFRFYCENQYTGQITSSVSVTSRIKIVKKQIDFIQKSIVNIIYENNNKSAKGMKEGYVYAISNPAWPDFVKVGCSIDVYDRFSTYQTSSPHRDFELIDYVFTIDRTALESEIHTKFHSQGEWVKTTPKEIKTLLNSYSIYPETDILKFCLTKASNLYISSITDNKSDRNKFKSTLKMYHFYISKLLDIDTCKLMDLFESKNSYVTNKSMIKVKGTNIKYDLNDMKISF